MGDLYLKKCSETDIADIMELQEKIFEDLGEHNDLLRQNSKEIFLICLKEPNITIGLYDGDNLVGITIMDAQTESKEDLKKEIRSVKIDNDVYMKLIMIRKQYYGHGYQLKMLKLIEKIAFFRGYEYLTVTVSPHNYHSKKNLLDYGYIFDHSALKYGGLERDVMYKPVNMKAYFENLFEKADELIDNNIKLSPELLGIDLSKCYPGTTDLLLSGDIVEYTDSENNVFYGLYKEDDKKRVLLYTPIHKRVKYYEFSELIDGLRLEKIWICV